MCIIIPIGIYYCLVLDYAVKVAKFQSVKKERK
jgi:hypothetical protein